MTERPELTPELTSGPTSGPVVTRGRRQFLGAGAALGVAAIVMAACGDDEDDSAAPTTSAGGAADEATTTEAEAAATTEAEAEATTTTGRSTTTAAATTTTSAAPGGSASDGELATVAAGLEVLAVNTYGQALQAAQGGALGAVPPAVAEFVTTAQSQHQAALDAWNAVLSAAGAPEVSQPDAELAATVASQFGQVTDVTGAAQLALGLEETAADTYLQAISVLSDPAAIELAGSIYSVDRQHIAILLFVLGQYPVPQVFGTVEKSVA